MQPVSCFYCVTATKCFGFIVSDVSKHAIPDTCMTKLNVMCIGKLIPTHLYHNNIAVNNSIKCRRFTSYIKTHTALNLSSVNFERLEKNV